MPPFVWPRILENSNYKYIRPRKRSDVRYRDIAKALLRYYWDFIDNSEDIKVKYKRLYKVVNRSFSL